MCRNHENVFGCWAKRMGCPRRGMTLLELLAVVGIIAILCVLLLPAVNSVIESSRRSGCLQNEKQIALAAAQYAAANRQLPGWRNEVMSAVGPQYPSWSVLLLPHLDQQAVFDQWMSGAFFDPSGEVPKAPMLAAFICPSAKRRGTIPGWPSNHYVGNCGTGISFDGAGATHRNHSAVTDWRIWPGDGVMVDTAPRIKKPLPFALTPQPYPLLDTYWCEVAKQQSEIAAAGITNPVVIRQSMTPDYINANDGLSNTLLFSERSGFFRNGSNPNVLYTLVALPCWDGRYQSRDGSTRKMVWGDGLMNFYYTGNIYDTIYSNLPWIGGNGGNTYPLPIPAFGLWGHGSFNSPVGGVVNNNTTNQTYHYFFASSRHQGGVVAALCDGRTVFLSNELEPYVYAQLITSSQVNSPAVTSYLNLAPANRRPYILDEKDYQ